MTLACPPNTGRSDRHQVSAYIGADGEVIRSGEAVCPECGHVFRPEPPQLPAPRRTAPDRSPKPKRIGGSNQVVSSKEAAAYLGVSYTRFIKRYRAEWGLVPVGLDSRLRFRVRDLDSLIESRMK